MQFREQMSLLWKSKDLRNGILTILGILTLFRLISHIPLPGVNAAGLASLLQQNQFLGLLNVFTGGTIERFSVVGMGVGPYITASIIIQLLTMVIPKLEELQKEGEQGQQKLNTYMRYLTIPLCFLQGYGLIALLRQSSATAFTDVSAFSIITMMITMSAGTMFLMWLGEIMTEKKMGNGVSMIIFAGIIAALPQYVAQEIAVFDPSQIIMLIAFAAIAVITIAGVVLVTEGQRNIPVTYAKQVRGMPLAGSVNTYLPLRVNMSGVIPIIFAISLILFPQVIAQLFVNAKTAWIAGAAQGVIRFLQPDQIMYAVLYFLLVIGFTFFYTSVIFQPTQIAENLQKQGGFIPGIRPGQPTVKHLTYVMNRVTLAGAVFLGVIAVLPLTVQQLTGTKALVVGGTSLLIVVSVVIETVKQIQSQISMREYEM